MGNRVNRAVELLSQDQPIYYTGAHTGHVLTFEQGQNDASTWGGLYQCWYGTRGF